MLATGSVQAVLVVLWGSAAVEPSASRSSSAAMRRMDEAMREYSGGQFSSGD
jgi:hypothetical protein